MEAIYHIWPFFTHTHTPLLNFRTKFVPAGLSVAGIEPPPPSIWGGGYMPLTHAIYNPDCNWCEAVESRQLPAALID